MQRTSRDRTGSSAMAFLAFQHEFLLARIISKRQSSMLVFSLHILGIVSDERQLPCWDNSCRTAIMLSLISQCSTSCLRLLQAGAQMSFVASFRRSKTTGSARGKGGGLRKDTDFRPTNLPPTSVLYQAFRSYDRKSCPSLVFVTSITSLEHNISSTGVNDVACE